MYVHASVCIDMYTYMQALSTCIHTRRNENLLDECRRRVMWPRTEINQTSKETNAAKQKKAKFQRAMRRAYLRSTYA